jgi:hypothetical protein
MGIPLEEALQLAELVPFALIAQPPQHVPFLKRPGAKFFATACGLLVLMLVFVAIIIYIQQTATDGWQEGQCNFLAYTNDTCTGTSCTFDIEITDRTGGGLKTRTYREFAIPVVLDLDNPPMVRISAEPFRCCNPSGSLSCCDMYDTKMFSYCDNSPHLDDPDGVPCPKGDWQCLFKLEQTDEGLEEVSELQAFEDPDVLPLIISAVALAVLSVCIGSCGYCEKTRCWGMEKTFALGGVKVRAESESKGRFSVFTRLNATAGALLLFNRQMEKRDHALRHLQEKDEKYLERGMSVFENAHSEGGTADVRFAVGEDPTAKIQETQHSAGLIGAGAQRRQRGTILGTITAANFHTGADDDDDDDDMLMTHSESLGNLERRGAAGAT